MTKFSELLLSEEGSTMLFENIYISEWKSELITIICRFAWCDGNHHCWLTRELPGPVLLPTFGVYMNNWVSRRAWGGQSRTFIQFFKSSSLTHSIASAFHTLDTVPIRVNKRWTKIVSWVSKKCTQCTLASRSESYLRSFFFALFSPCPPRRVECSSRHLGCIRNSSSLSAWKIELIAFLHFHFILIIHRCKFLLRLSAPRSFAHLKKISFSLSRVCKLCTAISRDPVPFACNPLLSRPKERSGRVIECRWYFEAERNEKWKSENRKSRSRQSKIGDRHGDDDYGF